MQTPIFLKSFLRVGAHALGLPGYDVIVVLISLNFHTHKISDFEAFGSFRYFPLRLRRKKGDISISGYKADRSLVFS